MRLRLFFFLVAEMLSLQFETYISTYIPKINAQKAFKILSTMKNLPITIHTYKNGFYSKKNVGILYKIELYML